ncbi:MAG: ATP-dependent Clp protease adaptor ClpS [Sandaracinaceae bacterium]
MSEKWETDDNVITEPKRHEKLQRPRMYAVLMHNDDYTTREFVVDVLRAVFHHSDSEARRIMLHVHYNGMGVAGIYTREVAETKIRTVEHLAREHEYPLRLSMEPTEDED